MKKLKPIDWLFVALFLGIPALYVLATAEGWID